MGAGMGMVTVEDAAHRLGVSVATVRRRLAVGRLLGTKVGRDWHVDDTGLPAIGAIGRKSRATGFTDDELATAIRYLSNFDLSDLWVPDALRWEDYITNQPAMIAQAKDRAARGIPGPATEIRIPKSALASRAGILIDIVDRVVYQAAVSRMAPAIDAATSDRVFSSRLTDDKRFFFIRSINQWKEWRKAYLGELRARGGLLVSTDLSSYFELVDQSTLLKELEELTDETFAIETLRKQLRQWSVLMHRGIPQGPNASRLLGNAYLLPVDEYMLEKGYNYWRYMDDVAIIVADRAEATRTAGDFERACHRRGLLVSSSKTEVQTLVEAEAGSGDAVKAAADYLTRIGSSSVRMPLRKMFEKAVPRDGTIDIGNAKFALWRLAQLLDKGPLARLLARIEDLGPIASVSAAYLRRFLTAPRTAKGIGEFLNDPERNTSTHLEAWLFAAMLEHPSRPPDTWLARARVVAFDKNAAHYHRTLAMNALALSSRASDIAQLRRVIASEHDPEVVRGALVALARVSKIDGPTEAVLAARHPGLSETRAYLKGRKDLPSLVYRGRTVPIRR
jgi:excisionase family DNA binding protein